MAQHVLALGRLADFMQIVVGEYVFAKFHRGVFLQTRRHDFTGSEQGRRKRGDRRCLGRPRWLGCPRLPERVAIESLNGDRWPNSCLDCTPAPGR